TWPGSKLPTEQAPDTISPAIRISPTVCGRLLSSRKRGRLTLSSTGHKSQSRVQRGNPRIFAPMPGATPGLLGDRVDRHSSFARAAGNNQREAVCTFSDFDSFKRLDSHRPVIYNETHVSAPRKSAHIRLALQESHR